MSEQVRLHYEAYPYPYYSYLASVRKCDTYALNLESLWAAFNGQLPPAGARRILLAGCGSFSPYPTSLANPDAAITALDLSRTNLRRARIHALLHGCRNITYEVGDLMDSTTSPGEYGFIDSFGVLHHLADPLAGLRALEKRLIPGGILRIMVYGREARRAAESIRRALRLLEVRDVADVKRMLRRADRDSRFYQFAHASDETTFDAGLADAFLHPCVKTYRIDELLELVGQTTLTPLLFAHWGALPDVEQEIARLRELEQKREFEKNFVLYLGKAPQGECRPADGTVLWLNPALHGCLRGWRFGPLQVMPRLGIANPLLDRTAQRLLRRFRVPVPLAEVSADELTRLEPFRRALFVVAFQQV